MTRGAPAARPTPKARPKADLNITLVPPTIGRVWPGQGGYYAGIIRDGKKHWHLITAKGPKAAIEAPWGEYGVEISGVFSRRDGLHNTKLILAADPKNVIATHFGSLKIEGHTDFYWPSQFEQNLMLINTPDRLDSTWHWSSTQYSANNAWLQSFEGGNQGIYVKDTTLAARAVRRLIIE